MLLCPAVLFAQDQARTVILTPVNQLSAVELKEAVDLIRKTSEEGTTVQVNLLKSEITVIAPQATDFTPMISRLEDVNCFFYSNLELNRSDVKERYIAAQGEAYAKSTTSDTLFVTQAQLNTMSEAKRNRMQQSSNVVIK